MGRETNKLEALRLKRGLPEGRHWDGEGLYLEVVSPTSMYWRFKYRFAGKEKRIGFGVYPTVSLAQARERRTAVKAQVAQGIDPSAARQAEKSKARVEIEGTFASVAEAWYQHKLADWADQTRRKARFVLDEYLLPEFQSQPIATLATKQISPFLRSMGKSVPDLARKARQYLNGIVYYSIQSGLREEDRLLVLDGLIPKSDTQNIPAITLPNEIGGLISTIKGYSSEVTREALLMCAYTAQRPIMVAGMEWAEIDLDSAEWRIPPTKLKTKHTHIVPLPTQAIAVLVHMKRYTGGTGYVFPPLARQKTPHLHRDTLSNALRKMGYQGVHATHGFRGMLRTAARERLGVDLDVLEAQLAHAKKNQVQKAYDRTTFDDVRKETMQRWADWIDQLSETSRAKPIADS